MKNAKRRGARLAWIAALCIAACEGSSKSQYDATSRFILDALTTKSQQDSGPTTISSNRAIVRFSYSAEVPIALRGVLEKSSQMLAGSGLELHSCAFEDGNATEPGLDCSDMGTTISVFVAETVDDFNILARQVANTSSEAKFDAESTIDTVDLAVSTGVALGKDDPPLCAYTRLPDSQRKIVGGTITVLSLDEEAAQKCLLSSLYRIAGVEPYPEGTASRTVEYLTAQTFGENPATALRFLYETRPTTRSLDDLRQKIEHWVGAQNAP